MAVPRPLLLVLLGVILLSATFVASRNAQQSADGGGGPARQAAGPATPSPAKPKAQAAKPADENAAKPGAKRPAPAQPAPARPAARPGPPEPPRALVRALERHRLVVLAFFQNGSDDAATRRAVAGVRGMRGVSVFTAELRQLGRYSPVIGTVGVDRAPAVVIVDKKRRAHLIQAYVDSKTLAQEIADARG